MGEPQLMTHDMHGAADHFRGFLLHVLREGELSTQVEILKPII